MEWRNGHRLQPGFQRQDRSARQAGVANAARQADLTIWGVYLHARAQANTALASYVEQRFTDHFRVAYRAWIAEHEPTAGPFKMKEYVPPGTTEAADADQSADRRFADALLFHQRGDNYTLLTVRSRLRHGDGSSLSQP